MSKTINLKRSAYESAKISVKRGALYSTDILENLKQLEFEEILKFMEENGFKEPIDTSYLAYEGFYLIEVVLNKYLSQMYGDVMSSASKSNKEFLEHYYLKYQIHNLMTVVRCNLAKEKDISPYLIGDNRRQEKYIKAFEMPLEDGVVYLSKKLKFDEVGVIEALSKGLFELENYLYAQYYENLFKGTLKYNNRDEKKFNSFIRTYVDILNSRAYLKLKVDGIEQISFTDIYVEGGTESLEFYTDLDSKDEQMILEVFAQKFQKDVHSFATLDSLFNSHKGEGVIMFKQVAFGSPFYVLKFFFELEKQINTLRYLLKAKYMKLSDEEINTLMGKEQ
jgi:vacuolar-type H+-ATPase subunit C/Vma6